MFPVIGGKAWSRDMAERSNGGSREGYVVLNQEGRLWANSFFRSCDEALEMVASGYGACLMGKGQLEVVPARQAIEWGDRIKAERQS